MKRNIELIKLFIRIRPDVKEQGIPLMDRLVVNGKRKSIPIFLKDEDSYYKDKIFESEEENGTMQVRMQSLNEPSYAFKIFLYDKAGQFLRQSKINIDKFLEDPLRLRNKLGMELMRNLDILVPVNIRFGQLLMSDANESLDNEYLNYGLYFISEQIDKNFLIHHGLDSNGALYEVDNFDMSSGNLKTAINKQIERRGRNADNELEVVLKKLALDIPIMNVIEDDFDMENILDYMAFSILVDKEDPGEEDYVLYSSLVNGKWYIFPSTCRDTFGNYKFAQWKTGIHAFYENPLFRKAIENEDIRKLLIERVSTMYQELKKQDFDTMITDYEKVIMPHLSSLPDYQYMEMAIPLFRDELRDFPERIDANYERFTNSLDYPSPTRISDDDRYVFWEPSNSFVGASVQYKLQVSKYPDFREILLDLPQLTETQYYLEGLTPGTYFVKVTVHDEQGYEQVAINRYTDSFGKSFKGIEKLSIE